jgi:hypothetical protein
VNEYVELLSFANQKIAELEKELSETKDIIAANQIADDEGYIDGVGWVENWSEMEEAVINLLDAHNLEQQAKALCDYAWSTSALTEKGLWDEALTLQAQADALKEGKL